MTAAISLIDAEVRTKDHVRLHPTRLDVRRGVITAVAGPNGSGKSTLLGLMAGEIRPTGGHVTLEGVDVTTVGTRDLARRRALLAQDRHVEFGFAVEDVVRWGRTAWRGTPQADHDRDVVHRLMADHDLLPIADRAVTSLSGGERTRVHLARVLAQEAVLLLIDEADADLDLVGRHRLDAAMRAHADSGGTVVVVSHDVARIRRVSDDAVLLADGAVRATGAAQDVLADGRLADVFGIPVDLG